uniref:Uncharacterized protein n=1 Tax=Glossina morsitans morsitans TaxID=37546 RepID=A0A1B0G7P2_GLOMM
MSFQKTGEITLTPNQELIVELANLETAISGDPSKTFEDDTLPSTSGTTRSPNMMDSSGEDDIPAPARKKRKWASHNEIAEKINTRADILDLLRDHIIGEQDYKKKKLRHQERIVQLLRERNEEERSFHSSMLKLIKEKNGLLRQIPREFESEED